MPGFCNRISDSTHYKRRMRRIAVDSSERYRIVLLSMMAALLSILNSSHGAHAENPSPAVYHTAPNFSRADLAHRNVELTAYRGKVVLLNFWATWCAPCLTEIPRFVEWQRKYGGRGLQVIGISMDDNEAPVRAAYQKYRLNYPVVMGDEKLGEMYGGILGVPVTLIIDRSGKIRFKHQGAVDLDIIDREIRTLLPRH
jgi:cytochrome c biogenesis protein CcmG, thiol:disulfide interchange protein DsbE